MIQGRFYRWLCAGIVLAVLVASLFMLSSKIELRTIERDQARAQTKAEQRAHVQSILNYRKAAAAAQIAADRNVARVEGEQAAITKGTVDDYQARLAAVDARLQRVRAQIAAQTNLGSADLAPVSLASAATCRAYGGGDCDALLAKLAVAERQAENLVALRKWVRGQARVIVTPDSQAEGH